MSRQPSFLHPIHEGSPAASFYDGASQISLIDHSQPVDPDDAERNDSEAGITSASTPAIERTPSQVPLYKKVTSGSLPDTVRQQIAKQKYAKYDRDRYDLNDPVELSQTPRPREGDDASPTQTSYLERSRAKAKVILKRKKNWGQGKHEQDAALDILYENQRGAFLFGIPRYSASSLVPSDPKAWQNAQFRTSPVDIRNAQVPDPSWEWAWKSWYVDMSRDVDEEGWEYSFMFKAGFNWHGNHPWFHSFVRRRRWLRLRKRKDLTHHVTKEKAHELTADYFTIHPKTLTPGSERGSKSYSVDLARLRLKKEEELNISAAEITDIASLINILKKSAVDREKLVAVRKFVSGGGEELYYLSQRMPEIMSLFIYQSSRRQLLSELTSHYDEAHKEREGLTQHEHADNEDGQKNHEVAVRHAENLMHAVEAADAQVKGLEYWSDIKDLAHQGEAIRGTANGHNKKPFASKQDYAEGTPDLHPHPEHSEKETDSDRPPGKRASSIWFDSSSRKGVKSPTTEDEDDDLDRYTTAAESASEISSPESRGKSKSRKAREAMRGLDGVLEGAEEGVEEKLVSVGEEDKDAERDGPDMPEEEGFEAMMPDPIEDET